MAQLHHALGPGQIAQRVGAEIGQPHIVGQRVDNEVIGCARQHGLAAVGQVAQSGRAIDGRADVVALIPQPYLASVDPDAQPNRRQRRPLQIQGAGDRVGRPAECDHEAVALTLLDRSYAVVGCDRFAQCLVQACHRGGHHLGLGLPQPR